MGIVLNPFKKHDVSDFPGVYQPLEQFQGHPTAVAAAERRQSAVPGVKPRSGHGSSNQQENGKKKRKTSSSDDSANEKDAEEGRNVHNNVDQYSAYTLEGLRAEIDGDSVASGHDNIYDRKSKIINKAIQDIGMGRYQWQLFCLCGFGWLADNLWLQGVALTLPQLSLEFGVSTTSVRYTTCATFVGLCCGATFWGIMSDVVGRRVAFNFTLMIAGIFGLAVGFGNSWIAVCSMYACLGFGVGGNLPVDGALFLEFLPMASGNLLTMLSVWWPVGQLIASLVAWPLIVNYTCDPSGELPSCVTHPNAEKCCARVNNMGWRYMNITLGALTLLMFICRFFFFHLFESPKFLLSRGRQAEAVATVHGIAYKNKSQTWLTEDILNEIGGITDASDGGKLTRLEVIQRTLSKFSAGRIAPLFHEKRLAIMTVLLFFVWATVGMGHPLLNAFLPQYLADSGNGGSEPANIVYRNYAITSVVGVPGSIIACYTVDIPHVGRKGTISAATIITGVLIYCFTISPDSNVQVAMTSLEAFFQNIMYGVLYAYTPEVFPAPNRGTGTGICSLLNRICGLCAPLVAISAGNANPKAPIYASGGLMLAAFAAMVLFPIETRGKQSL